MPVSKVGRPKKAEGVNKIMLSLTDGELQALEKLRMSDSFPASRQTVMMGIIRAYLTKKGLL